MNFLLHCLMVLCGIIVLTAAATWLDALHR